MYVKLKWPEVGVFKIPRPLVRNSQMGWIWPNGLWAHEFSLIDSHWDTVAELSSVHRKIELVTEHLMLWWETLILVRIHHLFLASPPPAPRAADWRWRSARILSSKVSKVICYFTFFIAFRQLQKLGFRGLGATVIYFYTSQIQRWDFWRSIWRNLDAISQAISWGPSIAKRELLVNSSGDLGYLQFKLQFFLDPKFLIGEIECSRWLILKWLMFCLQISYLHWIVMMHIIRALTLSVYKGGFWFHITACILFLCIIDWGVLQ